MSEEMFISDVNYMKKQFTLDQRNNRVRSQNVGIYNAAKAEIQDVQKHMKNQNIVTTVNNSLDTEIGDRLKYSAENKIVDVIVEGGK